MRKKIIAGNWKMNNDVGQSSELIAALLQKLPQTKAEVIIAPSFVNLALAVEKTKGSPIVVAAQNMHFAEKGAFTGEVSASMLEAIGVRTTILGHSERREYFNETDESLAKKVDTALAHQFRIIFCIGEKLAERKAEKHFEVVQRQIEKALYLRMLGSILYLLTNQYGLLVRVRQLLLSKRKRYTLLSARP